MLSFSGQFSWNKNIVSYYMVLRPAGLHDSSHENVQRARFQRERDECGPAGACH